MDNSFKEILWNQFGASLDMLENALVTCPDNLWDTKAKFWYTAYHVLFWTDYYLSTEPEKFSPLPPFKMAASDISEAIPATAYSKEELLAYVQGCRNKCHQLITGLTDEIACQRWINDRKDYPFFEIMLYNMRHVQHHTAQLNLLLRQGVNDAPRWVSRARMSL
jgi:DinB superfamily